MNDSEKFAASRINLFSAGNFDLKKKNLSLYIVQFFHLLFNSDYITPSTTTTSFKNNYIEQGLT